MRYLRSPKQVSYVLSENTEDRIGMTFSLYAVSL